MTRRLSNQRIGGFTLVEVIVVIVIVVVLVALLLPMLAKSRPRASRINCVSNLKQVGLAFRMWSQEHGDKFPWAVSTNEGGTLEFAKTGDVFRHYLALSNELSSPKVLRCASDEMRTAATGWDNPKFSNASISYFAGLDADERRPLSILSGDRNITTNGRLALGIVVLSTNTAPSWSKGLHAKGGNLGFADGSAQQFLAPDLHGPFQAAFTNYGVDSIRLAIP